MGWSLARSGADRPDDAAHDVAVHDDARADRRALVVAAVLLAAGAAGAAGCVAVGAGAVAGAIDEELRPVPVVEHLEQDWGLHLPRGTVGATVLTCDGGLDRNCTGIYRLDAHGADATGTDLDPAELTEARRMEAQAVIASIVGGAGSSEAVQAERCGPMHHAMGDDVLILCTTAGGEIFALERR